MRLAHYQDRSRIFVLLQPPELKTAPAPLHLTDMQDGTLLAEFDRSEVNRVAFRLCGLDIPAE